MKYSSSGACRTEGLSYFFLLFSVSIFMVYPKKNCYLMVYPKKDCYLMVYPKKDCYLMVYPKKDCYLIVPVEIQIVLLKLHGFNDLEK